MKLIHSIAVLAISCATLICARPGHASDLPNPDLTPGLVRPELTLQQICATKWGHDVRQVTAKMRNQVLAEYSDLCPSGMIEVDHLISRELGGADDVRNLWKQCYEAPVDGKKPSEVPEFGAHKKDRLENDFGKRICLPPSDPNYLPLEAAREALRTNWIVAYVQRFGDPRAQASAVGGAGK